MGTVLVVQVKSHPSSHPLTRRNRLVTIRRLAQPSDIAVWYVEWPIKAKLEYNYRFIL